MDSIEQIGLPPYGPPYFTVALDKAQLDVLGGTSRKEVPVIFGEGESTMLVSKGIGLVFGLIWSSTALNTVCVCVCEFLQVFWSQVEELPVGLFSCPVMAASLLHQRERRWRPFVCSHHLGHPAATGWGRSNRWWSHIKSLNRVWTTTSYHNNLTHLSVGVTLDLFISILDVWRHIEFSKCNQYFLNIALRFGLWFQERPAESLSSCRSCLTVSWFAC